MQPANSAFSALQGHACRPCLLAAAAPADTAVRGLLCCKACRPAQAQLAAQPDHIKSSGQLAALTVYALQQLHTLHPHSNAAHTPGSTPGTSPDCVLIRPGCCRESTVLEDKLEKLANQIGQFGLGAAVITFAAMAGQYTWHTLIQEGQPWDWGMLSTYLKYAITAITILVRSLSLTYLPCAC